MSSLFKCCTCAKKNKYDDDEDKRPKERKSKKKKFGKNKKTKDSRKDEDDALVKPFDTSSTPKLTNADDKAISNNTNENTNNDNNGSTQQPKTINIPVISINSYDDDTNKPVPSNNYFDEYYNNYKHNQSPPQHNVHLNSEGDEDDDGADDNDSYLTDSDLNISEAVFVSEVGPYVSAGTLNRSRNLINSFKPTYDNEKSLEADLIERASLSDRKHPDSGVTSIVDSSNGVAIYA